MGGDDDIEQYEYYADNRGEILEHPHLTINCDEYGPTFEDFTSSQ